MEKITFREYLPDDYEQVEKVNTKTLRVSFTYLYNIYHRKHPDLFIVAEDSEKKKIIGFILVSKNGGEVKKNAALVYAIGVLPKYRRLGVGKKLIEIIIKNLEKYPSVEELYLHVQQSNTEGWEFYKSLGFKHVETISNFYSWNEDAHQLSINLKEYILK